MSQPTSPGPAKPPANGFQIDLQAGGKYRVLRPEESQCLKEQLNKFSEESTKISAQEIEFKKGMR